MESVPELASKRRIADPVRLYPPQASLVILPPRAIGAFVGSGSAQSTPTTKRGIAALSTKVKRVVKDSGWNRQLKRTTPSRGAEPGRAGYQPCTSQYLSQQPLYLRKKKK